MTASKDLPVAVVGGGPVGLAAAAHLIERSLPVKVYEAGSCVGHNLRDWGHVRVFTPWRYCVDGASAAILQRYGWHRPPADRMPTGAELASDYLEPLAATPEMAAIIEMGARVTAISRLSMDKVVSRDREMHPFMLWIAGAHGMRRELARAVIDASGTWSTPNPLGAAGLPAEGEAEVADRIAYRIPDVLGRERHLYAGRTSLVIGAGHSAANALIDLVELARNEPGTAILWATRGADLTRIYGGGENDQLPARAELGILLKGVVDSGRVSVVTGFATTALRDVGGRVFVEGETADGTRCIGPVDRIVAVTGQRPDLSLTRELRLDLDPWLESAKALGPLIDPNVHSCGSVPPHGHRELAHPEPGFYTVGIKSYGRAPTFLLLTGYEQVRSVAAAIAGDMEAADKVQLMLPETGVCSGDVAEEGRSASGCCGKPPPEAVDTCCLADARAKAAGEPGCGCPAAA